MFEHIFSFDPSSPLLFTQFYFWAFFALVYAGLALIGNRTHLRNAYLFFVSLFFYYKTSGLSILILLFVICSDFLIAHRIEGSKGWRRKAWLILSVCIDLGLLCWFKYAYFLTDVIGNLLGTELKVVNVFGVIGNALAGTERFSVDRIVLPVGISFFIFQVISYSADVYRGDVKPLRNILDFGFYVSFFPQLVAGPIVRASEFLPQLQRKFCLSRRVFGLAVFWILNGLIKKIVLSDYIAVNFVDRVFGNPLLFTGFENLMALFAYSLQVYADFSGYTDIAIGVAMLMGFHLPQNFNSPYKASNPQDFWRRWHMSLSRWLRSYLYIPLGGNRNASFGTWFWIVLFALIAAILSDSWVVPTIFLVIAAALLILAQVRPQTRKSIVANTNRFVTMLLGGLWHGASWNFIIWGGLNGLGMVIYQIWKAMTAGTRMLLTLSICALLGTLARLSPAPVWNMLAVWALALCLGTFIRFIYARFHSAKQGVADKPWVSRAAYVWGVLQTFVFITFTRLFFRSGSNLDPATANAEAWACARNMVNQIGSSWQMDLIPDICANYWKVFALVAIGLVIHLLPVRWKRWYRVHFALLPIPVMLLITVATVFLVYQFITADLQAFIYFQF